MPMSGSHGLEICTCMMFKPCELIINLCQGTNRIDSKERDGKGKQIAYELELLNSN